MSDRRARRVEFRTSAAARRALSRAHAAGQIAVGPALAALRDALAASWDRRHCSLTLNGFSALQTALEALDVRGRSVLVPEVSSCFAPLNAVLAAGGLPAFRAVDANGLMIARDEDMKPATAPAAALLPFHFFVPAKVPAGLGSLACPVVADAALAMLFPDAANRFLRDVSGPAAICLSFYPTKGIPAIDGGAVLCADQALADRIAGKIEYRTQTEFEALPRHNFAMSNLQAAVALAEVESAAKVRAKMRTIFDVYGSRIRFDGPVKPYGEIGSFSHGRYILRTESASQASRLRSALAGEEVETGREFLRLVPPGQPLSETGSALIETTLSLPFHAWLTKADAVRIADAVNHHAAGL